MKPVLSRHYTDIRGVQIQDDNIIEMLGTIGKTEEEVLAFLGDYASIHGFMFNFLDQYERQFLWFNPKAKT